MKTQAKGVLPTPHYTLNPSFFYANVLRIYRSSQYFIVPKSRAHAALGNPTSRGWSSLFSRWLLVLLLVVGGIGWGFGQSEYVEIDNRTINQIEDLFKDCNGTIPEHPTQDCYWDGDGEHGSFLLSPKNQSSLIKGTTYTFCGTVTRMNKKRFVAFEAIYYNPNTNKTWNSELASTSIAAREYHVFNVSLEVPCDKYIVAFRIRYKKSGEDLECKYWPVIDPVTYPTIPTPITKIFCEPGMQTIVVDNPDNADVLYYRNAHMASLNDVDRLMSSQELSGYTQIQQHSDGKFHITLNVNAPMQYVFFYGNHGTDCTVKHNSHPSLLTLVLAPTAHLQLPTDTLIRCKEDLNNVNCNVLGVTYALLPDATELVDSLIPDSIITLPYARISYDSVYGNWSPKGYSQSNALGEKACYKDVKMMTPDCLDYTYKLTMEGKVHIVNLGDMEENFPTTPAFFPINCSKTIISKTVCLGVQAPKPKMFIRCSETDSVKFECDADVDGIRVYQDITSSTPINTVPFPPNFQNHGEKSAYYNCGFKPGTAGTGGLGNAGNAGSQSAYVPYNYENRFVLPAHLIGSGQKVFYVSYFRYLPTGGIRESQRVPIGVFTMPNSFAIQLEEYELLKPENAPCEPLSRALLPNTDSIKNLIVGPMLDSMIQIFNSTDVSINDTVHVNNPLQITNLDYTFNWSHPVNPNTGIPGVSQVCYDDLPSDPGSCRKYTLDLTVSVQYATQSICLGQLNPNYIEDSIVNCTMTMAEVDICKFMYPPKPEVFYMCDKELVQDFKLEQPVEKYPKIIWEYDPGTPKYIVDSVLTMKYSDLAEDNNPGSPYLVFQCHTKAINGRTSESMPVLLICPFATQSPTVVYAPVNEPMTASPNDFNQYCLNSQPELSTFHTLSFDPSQVIDAINDTYRAIDSTSGGMVQPSANFDLVWSPYLDSNQNELYHQGSNFDRVCYGHLPPGPRTSGPDDKGRTYTASLNTDVSICFNMGTPGGVEMPANVAKYYQQYNIDTLGVCLDSIPCSLELQDVRVHKVINVNPNASCLNGIPPVIDFMGCDNSNFSQACFEDTIIIGHFGVLPGTNHQFEWTDDMGNPVPQISDHTIRNPQWVYDASLLAAQGQVKKYFCKIKYFDQTRMQDDSLYHCEYIYLCGHCQNVPRTSESIQDSICADLKVVPNPVSDRAHIEWAGDLNQQLHFTITDPIGIIQDQFWVEQEKSEINLSGRMPGIYFGRLTIDSQHTCEVQISKL